MATDCILIFDVGKTNKKILIFDKQYRMLHEESVQLNETTDEDGFPCEDVDKLTEWIKSSLKRILVNNVFDVKAINFSGYGASFVCVDAAFKPVMALSNYLKPYPQNILKSFYEKYGDVETFSKKCSSPALGSLNSALQLFRAKIEHPQLFKKVKWALHLPQYLSAIVTQYACSDMTSIGCHTGMWDFTNNNYHRWITEEGVLPKLPEILPGNKTKDVILEGRSIAVGIGLHDSSAALVPYLVNFNEPFVLLSTGTWNISLNPFNRSPLTGEELKQDCLCYLGLTGQPVKASRLFAGFEHDLKVKALAEEFHLAAKYFQHLKPKDNGDLSFNELPAIAYLEFMNELVDKQEKSLRLVLSEGVSRIFVDGGFGKNEVFMKLMSQRFPSQRLFASTIPQASALGAAIAIHSSWNTERISEHLIDLKRIHP
jgi:L-fuculokinase